jgi:hypothetical protein
MLHFNLIQAPWDLRRAFVPMEATSGQGKNAVWLPGNIMETISGVNGVCSRIDPSAANIVDLGTGFWRMEAKGMLLNTTWAMIECARTMWSTLHQRNIHHH